MIAIAIVALAVLTGWHLVYEAILAPSLRYVIRLQLFAVRDEARDLSIDESAADGGGALRDLDEAISTAIKVCTDLTLSDIVHVEKAVAEDEGAKATRVQRLNRLDQAPVAARAAWKKLTMLVAAAIAVNHGGWLIYVVPVGIVLLSWNRLVDRVRWLLSSPPRATMFVMERQHRLELST